MAFDNFGGIKPFDFSFLRPEKEKAPDFSAEDAPGCP